jgi:hypothetical protein
MSPKDKLYDAKVMGLKQYVELHVSKQDREMFPIARTCALDLAKLGRQFAKAKAKIERDASSPSA